MLLLEVHAAMDPMDGPGHHPFAVDGKGSAQV
jgi:hypothetical protein